MSTDTRGLREVVQVRDFRRLMSVRVLGQFADGLFQAALFSAVFFNPERATSAGEAAAGFATLLLPYSVVGPFAGVLPRPVAAAAGARRRQPGAGPA